MKLRNIWALESVKNLPMLIGFVFAARWWGFSIPLAFATLVLGVSAGVALTRFIEPHLHREKFEMRAANVVLNLALFIGLAIPFLYYFRFESPWLNWKTDLLAGVAAGLLLTWGQSRAWTGNPARMVLHGAAMAVSFPIIIAGLRVIIKLWSDGYALFLTVLLTCFASLVIAAIDYRDMYAESRSK